MTTIIDKRNVGKNKSASNRRRFLDRYKRSIKKSVEDIAKKKAMKDFFKKGIEDIKINKDTIKEPVFRHSDDKGDYNKVLPGNKKYQKGDQIPKPTQGGGGSGGRQASEDGEGKDNFLFTLTKEEFIELYFADMELPNFIKEGLVSQKQFTLEKTGTTKYGVPARLNIIKTVEAAIARRISTKAQGKKPRYFDEVDLRYDLYTQVPHKIKKAVMFCVMDVSASMDEFRKQVSKKFFLLLYLFLHKTYDSIEVRFIRHTHEAQEVDEHTFFYDPHSGGTLVSTAFVLIDEIINNDYDLNKVNIYIAQASDGDNWMQDNGALERILQEKILNYIQYFAYVEVGSTDYKVTIAQDWWPSVYDLYEPISRRYDKFNIKKVAKESDVYPVLRELFEKRS